MPEKSPRLALSYIAPQQAQKHVTVNESLRRLDVLTQLTVRSSRRDDEPTAPGEGEGYVLTPGRTGANWSAMTAHRLAIFQDGAWVEITPQAGWRAYALDEAALLVFDGTSWSAATTAGDGESGGVTPTSLSDGSHALIGVNGANADETKRLSVRTPAALFDAVDAVESGTGDCRIIVNKETASDTASHLFQTNFSGRAEFGLTGDDDFHIKVSPDGTNFRAAVIIDKDNGRIGVNGAPDGQSALFKVRGVDGSNPANGDLHVEKSGSGSYTILMLSNHAAGNAVESPFCVQRRARGSVEAPATVENGDWLGGFSFRGYAASDWRQRALVTGIVDGAVSGSTVPAGLAFYTGSTGILKRLEILSNGSVIVGAPSGGGRGAGAVSAQALYDDNTLLSCYVFDQVLDEHIDEAKWDGRVPDRRKADERDGETLTVKKAGALERRDHAPMRKFAARIGAAHDPLTLDGYAAHWKEKRHLTSMPNEAHFDAERGMAAGEWIQRLVETVEIQAVLIEQLNGRTKALETVRQNSR